MSAIIHQSEGLTVTSFHGGADRGPCLQFETTRPAQLTKEQVETLAAVLNHWLALQE